MGDPEPIAWIAQAQAPSSPAWASFDQVHAVFPYLPGRDEDPKYHLAFWSDGAVYRHEVASPQALGQSVGGTAVLTNETAPASPSNGIWLVNAIRKADGALVGLYRSAERQLGSAEPNAIHYTSGTALSADDGRTWHKQGPVVGQPSALETMGVAPEVACMVFDAERARWLGIGHGLGYISRDPNAAPGTWYGWHEGQFDQPEPDTTGSNLVESLPGLSEDMDECKLHYNTYLELFVLVFRPWDGHAIMQSYSRDGVTWSAPTPLMRSTSQQRLSHAQIIGASDVLHGRQAYLIYRQRTPEQNAGTTLVQRPIRFTHTPQTD